MENMEKKAYARITEKKFQCIKILLASGSTWIMDLTGKGDDGNV